MAFILLEPTMVKDSAPVRAGPAAPARRSATDAHAPAGTGWGPGAPSDLVARTFSPAARRLLEAADRLFYEHGAAATTVKEITASCGLSPGALYNHFESKDELLFVLVRYRHLRMERAVTDAQRRAGGEPVAELRAIVETYLRAHVDQRPSAEVANHEYRHLPDHHRREVAAIRRRLRNRVVDVLDRGAHRGEFDPPGGGGRSSLVITAGVILEMCIGASQWVHRDGPMDVDELSRTFTTIALRAAGHRSC